MVLMMCYFKNLLLMVRADLACFLSDHSLVESKVKLNIFTCTISIFFVFNLNIRNSFCCPPNPASVATAIPTPSFVTANECVLIC